MSYISFEQAKWLDEKGFDLPCDSFYHNGNFNNDSLGRTASGVIYEAPEQWQVVEWLRVNHDIWVSVNVTINMWFYSIHTPSTGKAIISTSDNHYNTPQEAYSAAFDYVLKELI